MRDQLRPLNYRGRILEGAIQKVANKDNFWKNASLIREGRTEPASQVQGKDLVVIEHADEEGDLALLDENDRNAIQGGYRVEQVGPNACEKLLSGMFSDLALTGRAGVFVVDLNMSVGDMFSAFTNLRGKYNFPVYYIGATDSAETLEWFQEHKTESRLLQLTGMN